MGFERDTLVRYLLGRSPQQERDEVAEQLIANDQVAQALEDTEYDLMDWYARGELNSADRKAVESRLLTGERQDEKLRFAEAFAYRPSGLNLWVFGAVAAALLIALSSMVAVTSLTKANASLQQALAQSRSTPALAQSRSTPAVASNAATLLLLPVQRGVAAEPVLHLGSGVAAIHLDLSGDSIVSGKPYNLRVTNPEGQEFLELRGAIAEGPAVSLWFGAAKLPNGRYEIDLSEPSGALLDSFEFRITQ